MHTGVDKGMLSAKAQAVVAPLAAGLGKVPSRFIADMVRGMLASDSVRLTRIAEALGEPIALHATHKRLSRNLDNRRTGEVLAANLIKAAADLIGQDALLVVDTFDLAKPHARRMEYLGGPSESSAAGTRRKAARRGYRVCEVFGWDVGGGPMPEFAELAQARAAEGDPPEPGTSAWNHLVVTPLAQQLWSTAAPDFHGEAAEVLALVDRVAGVCGDRGVFALDATSQPGWVESLVARPPGRFVVRLADDFELLHGGRPTTAAAAGQACQTPYGITVYKHREGFDEGVFIHFGFAPVRLPEHAGKPLWLIAIKGLTGTSDGWDPLLLMTNEPMRRSRKVLWRPVWSFLHYWDAVTTNRRIKRQFDFDDVRVLGYDRQRNIGTLMQAAAFVAAQWPGVPLAESLSLQPREGVPARFRNSP